MPGSVGHSLLASGTRAGRGGWESRHGAVDIHCASALPASEAMPDTRAFTLHELCIEPSSGEITGGGATRRLEPKPMAVLLTLVARPGDVVTRQELLDAVWPGVVVGDEAVTRCISELRDALGDTRGAPRFIRTLPKRGYVLLATPQPRSRTTVSTDADAAGPPSDVDATGAIESTRSPSATARTPLPMPPPRYVAALLVAALLALPVAARALLPTLATSRYDAVAIAGFTGNNSAATAYGHGIAEQLANTLHDLPGVTVRGPATTAPVDFATTPAERAATAMAVGERLGVDALLLGHLDRVAGRVRLGVELRASRDGSVLLARRYRAAASDIYRVQDELASDLADSLGVRTKAPLHVARVSDDLASYELYLLGRHHWNRRTVAALHRARSYFQQAVRADPTNARAWSGLADSDLLLAGNAAVPIAAARANAQEAINRALALAPQLAEAHASLGLLRYQRGDLHGAAVAHTRATELDPNYAMAWMWRAITSSAEGRLRDAHRELQRAVQLDPSHPTARANLLTVSISLGRYGEARQQAIALAQLQPEHAGYALFTFALAEELGDFNEMARIARQVRGASDSRGEGELLEARLAHARGAVPLARHWLAQAAQRADASFGYEVALFALDIAAFAGDVAEIEQRTLHVPDVLRDLDKPWPPSPLWLGIAHAQRGDYAAARAPLLQAVAALDAVNRDATYSLTIYGYAARACVGEASPPCTAVRRRLPVLIDELRAAGWQSASFERDVGLAWAALGDADRAFAALQRMERHAHQPHHTLADDVRLEPILQAREIAALLARLRAANA